MKDAKEWAVLLPNVYGVDVVTAAQVIRHAQIDALLWAHGVADYAAAAAIVARIDELELAPGGTGETRGT